MADRVDRLIGRAAALPDADLRRGSLYQGLSRLAPEEVALLIERLFAGSARGEPGAALLLRHLIAFDEAAQAIGPRRLAQVFAAADEQGYGFALELLNPSWHEKPPARLRAHKDLENVSLGERKTLARSLDRGVLEKLLLEPSADVVRLLLRNRRLRLREVLRIATRRPNRPEVLLEVFRSERWAALYPVRKALCSNPYTPARVAIGLLPGLTAADIGIVRGSSRIPASLVSAIAVARGQSGQGSG